MKSEIIISSLIVISAIIGLGIFVLPYTLLKSGIYFYFWLIVIPLLIFILHLIYGEILFQVEEKHNLPTLVGKIIHPRLKNFVWLVDYFGLMMVFIAYLVAMEEVLTKIWQITFNIKFILASVVCFLIFFKNNLFAKLDSFFSIVLILFFIFISFYFLPQFKLENFPSWENNFWLSYGILLFSFTGYQSLPIIYDILGKNKKNFLKVNLLSLSLIFLIYLIYASQIAVVVGENLKPLSLISLLDYFHHPFFNFISITLFLFSVMTTFISLAFYLKRGFIYDFKWQEKFSWLMVSLPIIFLSFFNFDNLIKIISFVGSLFVGFNLILILIAYLKLKEVYYFKISKYLVYLLILIFSLGWLFGLLSD